MIFSSSQRLRQRHLPDINVTSFIDVVLLLLIFFMLSTTFDRFGEIRIELPRADVEATQQKAPEQISLTIDQEGRYYVDQQEVINSSVDTLRQALRKALGDRASLPVEISADARSPYQALVTAMDAAGQAGLFQISFATLPQAHADSPGPGTAPH
jgi:biopolymer transport protein ExbD